MVKFRFWMLSILLVGFVFTSCNSDDPVVESLVLAEYLESADSPLMKDYVNTDMPALITATDVNSLNLTGQIYIIDIRSEADYAAGHIANAVNVAFGDLLTHVEALDMASYEKVAIVCYSGQTAAYGTCLLRVMGYEKVYSMKFGMCSWNSQFAGGWNGAISNMYATQFETTANAKGAEGDMPTLTTGFETGQEILEARVNTVMTEGFGEGKISAATVFANPADYYIINYWPEASYLDPGHIPGAVQYTPKEDIALNAYLKTIPTDKTVVVYCYTGQTSANLTAYLRLLGYDAKSLLYGANSMIYDVMVTAGMHPWDDSLIMEYDYVTE